MLVHSIIANLEHALAGQGVHIWRELPPTGGSGVILPIAVVTCDESYERRGAAIVVSGDVSIELWASHWTQLDDLVSLTLGTMHGGVLSQPDPNGQVSAVRSFALSRHERMDPANRAKGSTIKLSVRAGHDSWIGLQAGMVL